MMILCHSWEFQCCTIRLLLSFCNVKLIAEKHSNETEGGWLGHPGFIKDKNSIFIFKDNQRMLIVLIFYLLLLDNVSGSIFLTIHYKHVLNFWCVERALIVWCVSHVLHFFSFLLLAHKLSNINKLYEWLLKTLIF